MIIQKKFRKIIAAAVVWTVLGTSLVPAMADEMTITKEDTSSLMSYADAFNGEDVVLNIDGDNLETISQLREFSFQSLELKIVFPDVESATKASAPRTLLFPDATKKVTVLCGAQETIPSTEAMEHIIASLWVCCPDAQLNGQPVSELAELAKSKDTYGAFPYYETGYAMHLLYDRAMRGELEEAAGDPVYHGKPIFLVMGEGELTSVESMLFGESFFGVSNANLASNYDEADMAIFIFPEYSLIGHYSNGGEARCTYTRVLAVDLDKQVMYAPYTAVKQDPPADLPITVENGVYATDGADGAFAPEEAVQTIMAAVAANAEEAKKSAEVTPAETTSVQETTMAVQESQTAPQSTETETTSAQPVSDPAQETSAAAAENTALVEPEGRTAQENETTTAASGSDIVLKRGEGATTPQETTTAKSNKVLGTGLYSWLDEAMLDQILNALPDTSYRETYEALKTSKDLVYGSKGKLALGIQNALIAFDQPIAADSSVGNATLGALNGVQEAFGQEKTNKINANIYAMLMPCLLVYQDPETAEDLFGHIGQDEEGDFMTYLKACVLYLQGAGYRARLLFEESLYGDYEARLPHCIQDMPDTGEIYRNGQVEKGKGATLHIRVNSPNEAEAVCVRIFTENEELVSTLLVRGTGETQTTLAPGEYHLMDGSGYRWYGIQDLFGEDGRYSSMIFDDGTDRVSLLAGFDYTITFNVMEHDDAASSIGTQELEWDGIVSE